MMAIVGGLARFQGEPVMVIGHQKVEIPKSAANVILVCLIPKAIVKPYVLMEMAERFKLPIFTFIDTPVLIRGFKPKNVAKIEAIAKI